MTDNKVDLSSLPLNGRTVIITHNGEASSRRLLRNSEYIATIQEFIQICREAGYRIESPDEGSYS